MQRVNVTMIDDLDGHSLATETITFTIQGKHYEIDLSRENANKFREDLAPWMAAARPVTGEPATVETSAPVLKPTVSPSAVRAWAVSQGQPISMRGRLPKGLIRDYLAAQSAAKPTTHEAPESAVG